MVDLGWEDWTGHCQNSVLKLFVKKSLFKYSGKVLDFLDTYSLGGFCFCILVFSKINDRINWTTRILWPRYSGTYDLDKVRTDLLSTVIKLLINHCVLSYGFMVNNNVFSNSHKILHCIFRDFFIGFTILIF